jgi:outer membrane biosynthesis protein TonB
MLDGATMLLERSSEDGLADDIKTLHDAHEVVASFCTALATTIDFLRSDPSASYKSLEKQIGERETHIRALRASSKKVLEQTEPLIQRWIKKINTARIDNEKAAVTTTTKPAPAQEPKKDPAPVAAPQPKPEPKQDSKPAPTKPTISDAPAPAPKPEPPAPKPADATPLSAKFPSARKVKLPQLGGKWDVRGDSTTDVADYVENDTHTSVVAEAFSGVSCTAQLARLQAKAYGRQATKEQAGKGQAWRVRLPSSDTPTIVACASTRTGSALVTFDVPDSVHPDLSELAAAMLAALAK